MKQDKFEAYIESFTKLNIKTKEKELLDRQIEILNSLSKYANDHNISFNYLYSKELSVLTEDNISHDDYIEAMMVVTEEIDEIIRTILANKKID